MDIQTSANLIQFLFWTFIAGVTIAVFVGIPVLVHFIRKRIKKKQENKKVPQ